MEKKPDSLIFDMDGTLWDALDTYVNAWNLGLKEEKIDKTITGEQIAALMGKDSKKVLDALLPGYPTEEQFRIYDTINKHRQDLVQRVGGVLYDGVIEGLTELASRYKLFIVSNCPAGMIDLFITWAGIEDLITDEVAYGLNKQPKHKNIRLLIDKHQLQNPVYIGDTDGDRHESELAGIPFVFVSFGFGKTEKYALKFDDFKSFKDHFMSL